MIQVFIAVLVYLGMMVWRPDIQPIDRTLVALLVWLGCNQVEIFLHLKDIKDTMKNGLMVKVKLKDLQNLVKDE